MSWETKQDYCGLAEEGALDVKSANPNTTGQYLEKHGRLGSYKATKAFGVRSAPSNAYTVAGVARIAGKNLGEVNETDGRKFALEKISWSTGADQEPTVEANSQEVAPNAETRNTFEIPEFEISPDQIAQIPAFKFAGSVQAVPAFSIPTVNDKNAGVELTKCDGEISCKVGTNDKNGLPLAHDVTNGHIVLNLTFGQYGEATPEITLADGWKMSAPLNSEDPDSDMPTWTCSLSRPLEKKMAS